MLSSIDVMRLYDRLYPVQDRPIDHSDEIQADLQSSEVFSQHHFQTSTYSDQITLIRKHRPATLKEGTVGAYLHGCFYPEEQPHLTCTPSCLSGLFNPNLDPCIHPVYIKSNDQLTKIHSVIHDTAILYLQPNQSVQSSDLDYLRYDGVKSVRIYRQQDDTLHYNLEETIDITFTPSTIDGLSTTDPNGNITWFWVLVLIILLLFVVLVWTL